MMQVNTNTATESVDLDVGLIPSEWELVPFSSCHSTHTHRVGKVKKENYLEFGDYPVIDQGQTFIAGYTNAEDLVYSGSLPVIVFGDHTRILKYVDFPFVCGADGTKLISPDTRLFYPRFLYYGLLNIHIPSKGYNRHYKALTEQEIVKPPLAEQRRIAAMLNAIQDEIAAQNDLIAAAREFKRSLRQRLFTYGPASEPAMTKETEIGEIPAHWEIVQLGKYVDSYRNGFGRRPSHDEQGAIVLRLADVSSGYIDLSHPRYIAMSPDELDKYRVQQGDMLVIRVNGSRHYIGLPVVVDINREDLAFNDHLIRVRLKPGLRSDYLSFAISQPYARDLMVGSTTTSAGQLTINQTVLDQFPVPVPSTHEQDQVVAHIRAVENKIRIEEDRSTALQDLFKTMLHQLMTGQIRLLHDGGLPI